MAGHEFPPHVSPCAVPLQPGVVVPVPVPALVVGPQQRHGLTNPFSLLAHQGHLGQIAVQELLDHHVLLHLSQLLFVEDAGRVLQRNVLYLFWLDEEGQRQFSIKSEVGSFGVAEL